MRPRGSAFLSISSIILISMGLACLRLPDAPVEQTDRPSLILIASNLEDKQTDVVRNIRVELLFNQPLDPESLDDTEITITSGKIRVGGKRRYDLLQRKLTFIPDYNLRGNLWYKFILKNPPLSIMGTRSQESEINLLFRTGIDLAEIAPAPAEVSFASQVFPLMNANCDCHGSRNPSMGLQLVYDTPQEFLAGAVDQPSKEWKNWQVIHPGRHDKSYLMYKLLGDERLGLPTVTAERMPPPGFEPLPLENLEVIKNWIEQGALLGSP